MTQNNNSLKNIQRGLAITTQIDWVKNIPHEKDTTSSIQTLYPTSESKDICSLFTHEGIDIIHRELAKSFHINIDNLTDLQTIKINNKGHCDITVEVHNALKGKLYVEIVDESSQELITTGLTIITHKNTELEVVTNTINQPNKLHVNKHKCITKENSKVVWFTQTNGTRQVISEQKANLQGKNSSIKTISAISGINENRFDISTISHHLAKNTRSNIILKSVLENAQVLARGLVRIEPVANDSQGYQKSSILLLDEKAKAITIPDLEIENKDVMCSHGSTITNINEEKLFYLKSRGISEQKAKNLIIKGFIKSAYEYLSPELNNELTKNEEKELNEDEHEN